MSLFKKTTVAVVSIAFFLFSYGSYDVTNGPGNVTRYLYSYEILKNVRAQDVGDITPPTVPTNLRAFTFSENWINISWTASTDNVGVTGYKIERCQGAGCSSFAQITTVAGTTYNNTGLSASTSYSYRVRAYDAAGNNSSYSNTASATTLPAGGGYTLTLTISPAGGGTITCSTDGFSFGACAATYTSGTSLWLEATGLGFNDFSSWSAGSGSAAACSAAANRFTNPCTFTITSNSAVTAIFAPI